MSWGSPGKKQEGLGLTKETQQLLDGIMKQRGISQRATQEMASSIQKGDAVWVNHLSTGKATSFQAPKSKTATLVKVPKVGTGPAAHMPQMPPARFSGKKMQDEILRDTPPERDMWVGGAPVVDREKEKDRLSKVMELGPKGAREFEAKAAAMKAAALQRAARNKALDVKEEMIDQVIDEIRERREFLESMRAAGRGDQYEAQIRTEIQIRMFELEKLGLDTRPGG